MPSLTGQPLEQHGRSLLASLGLACYQGNRQARLRDLDPNVSHPSGDNLELDYLIPLGEVCAVGEITSRASTAASKKYRRFVRTFNVLNGIASTLPRRSNAARDAFWRQLGIPPTKVRDFRHVCELHGFFVIPTLERYDVSLEDSPRIAIFYKEDWKRLGEYAEAIGEYGKPMLVNALGVSASNDLTAIRIGGQPPVGNTSGPPVGATAARRTSPPVNLRLTSSRKIAGGSIALADVFTFEISPYSLLTAARVLRRDQLPDLGGGDSHNYQRPLQSEKLAAIREELLQDPDFMFPGNILVVLGPSSDYRDGVLSIPQTFGSISVVDGQHRLFSYAHSSVAAIQDNARISVMAIKFDTDDPAEVDRHSAQIFIEINTNQTSVRPAHLYAIAYPILGHTYPNALAAQILIGVNERGGALYGLVDVNQNSVGVIQPLTLLTTLRAFLNPDRIRRISNGQRAARRKRRLGYEALLGTSDLASLADNPQAFIQSGTACLGRFFDEVKRAFPYDFPTRSKPEPRSAIRYAKFVAALIRLFRKFADDGGDWDYVRAKLSAIRSNVLIARSVGANTHVVFADDSAEVPNASARVRQNYDFLEQNSRTPTSISAIS